MNLILLEQTDYCHDKRVRLFGRRKEHIQQVIGADLGKPLHVGMLNGLAGTGIIVDISKESIELEIELHQQPPRVLPVSLVLAMPRPKVFKRILQAVTALGIKRITLINTWHVDKSYWQSPALQHSALQRQCMLGLEQSMDTILPTISIHNRFKPFVEDVLPQMAANTCALIAHPDASQPCPHNIQGQMTLAVGPERGFTPYEIAKLEEAGMKKVNLGTRPLKVETAIPALLGRLYPL